MAIEKPEYQVLLKENKFELRRYAPFITADVQVSANDRREAANQGFGILAGFIFGKNISKQKISMTAPVTASSAPEKIAMTAPVTISGTDSFTVSFTMPRSYTLKTLPQPLDNRIIITKHPEKQVAAVLFSGFFNEKNFSKHEALLLNWMKSKNLKSDGKPMIAGYDPPFMPWFLKHNEILQDYSK